uniref:hypothetical protein n=1 Tax=Methylobacterium sp. B34 TaxID=95563 RepID=UPI00034AC680|nr:hypothetical protein [Methylobacterium sp. B34]
MEKPTLLDASGNPIRASKPAPQILDAQGRWLDGDAKGDLVLQRTQEVPDEFWERNAFLRDQSRINGPGWMMSAIRMPEIIEEALYRKYPAVHPEKWKSPGEPARLREMIKCLRAMGEDRCITTVWTF